MRQERFVARRLALWLTAADGSGWYGEERLAPVCDDQALLASLMRLFAIGREAGAPSNARSVHVALTDLARAEDQPRDLFEAEPDLKTRRRWEALSRTADALNKAHRRTSLHLGPWAEPPGGYAGAKIAFERIPDLDEF